jgi:hypothetical protein
MSPSRVVAPFGVPRWESPAENQREYSPAMLRNLVAPVDSSGTETHRVIPGRPRSGAKWRLSICRAAAEAGSSSECGNHRIESHQSTVTSPVTGPGL